MRGPFRWGVVVVLFVAASVGSSLAQEEAQGNFSASWDATVASKYLFQGLDYSDGKAVLQPEVVLGFKALSATVWANYDFNQEVSNEFDFVLQYGVELGRVSAAAGYGYLKYPHRAGWDPSQEVSAEFSFAAPLNPSLSVHYDFDAGDGAYATLGLGHAIVLGEATVDAGVELYYQKDYYGMTGCPSASVAAGVSRDLWLVTISPRVSYFTSWDNHDFRGLASPENTWLLSLNIAQEF